MGADEIDPSEPDDQGDLEAARSSEEESSYTEGEQSDLSEGDSSSENSSSEVESSERDSSGTEAYHSPGSEWDGPENIEPGTL